MVTGTRLRQVKLQQKQGNAVGPILMQQPEKQLVTADASAIIDTDLKTEDSLMVSTQEFQDK